MNLSILSITAFIGFVLDNVTDILYSSFGSVLIENPSSFVLANRVLIQRLFAAS